MRIYVASGWRNAYQPEVVRHLRRVVTTYPKLIQAVRTLEG